MRAEDEWTSLTLSSTKTVSTGVIYFSMTIQIPQPFSCQCPGKPHPSRCPLVYPLLTLYFAQTFPAFLPVKPESTVSTLGSETSSSPWSLSWLFSKIGFPHNIAFWSVETPKSHSCGDWLACANSSWPSPILIILTLTGQSRIIPGSHCLTNVLREPSLDGLVDGLGLVDAKSADNHHVWVTLLEPVENSQKWLIVQDEGHLIEDHLM